MLLVDAHARPISSPAQTSPPREIPFQWPGR